MPFSWKPSPPEKAAPWMFWGTMAVTAAVGGGSVFLLLVILDALIIAGSSQHGGRSIGLLLAVGSTDSDSTRGIPASIPLILIGAGALAGVLFTIRYWPARWENEAHERAAREYRPHPVFAAALREEKLYREALRKKQQAKKCKNGHPTGS